jgi:hypothetical protein
MERHQDIMLRLVLNTRLAAVRTVQESTFPTTAAATAAAAAAATMSRPPPVSRTPLAESTAFAPPPPLLPASSESEVTSPQQRCGRACAPAAGFLHTIDAAGLVSLQQLTMKLAHHMHLTLPVAQHIGWTQRLADERRTMVG